MRRFTLKTSLAVFVLFIAVTVSSVTGENSPAPQPQDPVAAAVPEVKQQDASEPQKQPPAEIAAPSVPPLQQQAVPKPSKSTLPYPAAFMQKFMQPRQAPAETAPPVSSQSAPQVKIEDKPEPNPEIKQEIKPEIKVEPKPGIKPEIKTEAPVPPAVTEAAPEVKPEVSPEAAKPAPVVVTHAAAPASPVSFFFDDADIFEVVQTIFGDVLKVNYIVDPKVKGRVNFRTTTPIPRSDILPVMEIILRLNGAAVVEEKGLYRIIPLNDIAREPSPVRFGKEPEAVELKGAALVQIVPLQNIGSADMARILMPLLSQGGAIIDVTRNFLIIADTDANVKRLLQLVRIFDSEQLGHIKPQVFVYPVQNSKAKAVADMLQQIFLGAKATAPAKPTAAQKPGAATPLSPQAAFPPVAQPPQSQASSGATGGDALVAETTRIIPDETTNSIVILATPDDYLAIAETIKKIDIVPRQVMIEGLIARVDLTDKLNFGMQWTLQNDFNISGIKPFKDVNMSGPLKLDTAITTPTFTFTAYDMAGNVKLLLQSLATDGKVKILASPHILVSDNREARIQVGSQIPVATQTTTTPISSGTTPSSTITSTVQYKDVGIILKVKPQVNDSGLVSLEITQEVSSRGELITIAGQGFEAINKTEANTTLVAQDGETIVIGGLIREDTNKSRSGIPLLSRIPLLGYLFGNTIDESTRNELIILLTPHVIRNQTEARNMTAEYMKRFKGIGEQIKKEGFIQGDTQGQSGGAAPMNEKR